MSTRAPPRVVTLMPAIPELATFVTEIRPAPVVSKRKGRRTAASGAPSVTIARIVDGAGGKVSPSVTVMRYVATFEAKKVGRSGVKAIRETSMLVTPPEHTKLLWRKLWLEWMNGATEPDSPASRVQQRPRGGYLRAVQELLASTGVVTYEAIGQKLGCKRQTAWDIARLPRFREWLNAQLEAATEDFWPKILHRAGVLAMRGSIDHMEFFAKARGKFMPATDSYGSPTLIAQQQVNLLVPGPDGTWALQPPDRPLPLPAGQSAPVAGPTASSRGPRVEAPVVEDPLDRMYRKLQPRASAR
jgi:hypothetical protein